MNLIMRPFFYAARLFDNPARRTLGQMSTAKVISEQEIERLDEEALSPSARKMRMLKKLHCGLRYERRRVPRVRFWWPVWTKSGEALCSDQW